MRICIFLLLFIFTHKIIAQDSTQISNDKLIELAQEKKEMRDSINIQTEIIKSQETIIGALKTSINNSNEIINIKNSQLELYLNEDHKKKPNKFLYFVSGIVFAWTTIVISSKL